MTQSMAPYTAEISRDNPSCFLFLIDQSGSMGDPFGGEPGSSKAQRLADAINRLLYELTLRCTKDQREGVRNYYDVGVLGYGAHVGPALSGKLDKRELVSIRDLANSPARVEERHRKVEDGAGGLVEEVVKLPIWFDAVSQGTTPMNAVFLQSHTILDQWVRKHPASFPPIVINITDGEPDADPRPQADELRRLATNGNLLLFNVHLSSKPGSSIVFPENESELPDEFARLLFQMSSVLPPYMNSAAKAAGYAVGLQSRGFVFQADMVEVIKFLDIGTRAKELR